MSEPTSSIAHANKAEKLPVNSISKKPPFLGKPPNVKARLLLRKMAQEQADVTARTQKKGQTRTGDKHDSALEPGASSPTNDSEKGTSAEDQSDKSTQTQTHTESTDGDENTDDSDMVTISPWIRQVPLIILAVAAVLYAWLLTWK